MTKSQSGVVKLALPFILLGITGLVGWGGHTQKLKHHDVQIEKKVDKEVFEEFKDSNETSHQRIERQLDSMHSDIKTLLQK